MSKKLCLECDQPLIGRVDKKFCNDMCRNAFNNKINKDANDYVRKVNVILRKNRRILSNLMKGKDKCKTTKEELLLNGFNFYYYTNLYQTKQGKTYYFVYELGYLELEDEQFALVKKQEYVK
tara:strand:+ start:1168 stop:1533 length:366 start_codon:yes stop_codon:yes gene_type:complete